MGLVDASIRDPLFWGYSHMMHTCFEVLARLSGFADSCPCHWDEPVLFHARRGDRGRFYQDQFGSRRCPLVGMQAPECAAGQIFSILNKLLQRDGFPRLLQGTQ
eukprot:2871903-Alexandrium_andersonii.AAC.1